jgi:outer membrane protein TolC
MRYLLYLTLLTSTASADRLTLNDAVQLALGKNPAVAHAREGITSSTAKLDNLRAKRLPKLDFIFNGDFYRQPYDLSFGGGLFRLHEQATSFTTVQIMEPLTGFAYITELTRAAEHDESAAKYELDRTRLDVASTTADMYMHVLQARANAEVAHRSVTDIASGLARAEQLRAADTYTDIDVLRFKSAKAAAEQLALRADTTRDSALATFVVQLGLPDGTPVEIVDDLPENPPALAITLETAQSRAVKARPELAVAREKLAVAESQHKTAYAPYFPDVRAVGEWHHSTGVQPFQPEDEELLGLRITWNLWDWGATRNAVREAEAARTRARIEVDAELERVKLDVRKKWLEAKASFDSLPSAATQLQAAEEAYRLQQVRFEAGASTTTDVLDAETDVARARLTASVARYEYFMSMIALARSIGDLPRGSL